MVASKVANNTPAAQRVAVIGPRGSGKSWSLAALQIAANLTGRTEYNALFDVRGPSPGMRALWGEAARIHDNGGVLRPDATKSIDDGYWFDLVETPRPKPSRLGAESWWEWLVRSLSPPRSKRHHVRVADTPGGLVFDSAATRRDPNFDQRVQEENLAKLVAMTQGCQGLILYADAADPGQAAAFFASLEGFFEQVAAGADFFPCRRVAFVLTKADQVFAHLGCAALATLLKESPVPRVERLLTRNGLAVLRKFLHPSAVVACGWSSAFGFLSTGQANYDLKTKRLAAYDEQNSAWVDTWKPFRLLDAYVFVATGDMNRMCPLELADPPAPPDLTPRAWPHKDLV